MNNLEHAKALSEAEGMIADVKMLAKGINYANDGMPDKEYANMSEGAFGLIYRVLDQAYELVSECGEKFVRSNGLHYPLDDCESKEVAGV